MDFREEEEIDITRTLRSNPYLFNPCNLAPVHDISKMIRLNDIFHFDEALSYIAQYAGINPRHFFYIRNQPAYPYCYYHNLLLLDMTAFTAQALYALQIPERILFLEKHFQALLADGDYHTLFSLIDQRLCLYAYRKLFDQMSNPDKSSLFWFMVNRCQMDLKHFSDDFLHYISALNPVPSLPSNTSHTDISIYYGFHHQEILDFKQAYIWSLNINTAVFNACKKGQAGSVFQAGIAPADILYVQTRFTRREVFVLPSQVKHVQKVELRSYQEIISALDESKLWSYYHTYINYLKPEYFHSPSGIHGISHTKRVLFLCLVLSMQSSLPEEEIKLLCICAIFHDIGRINDNWDLTHGVKSLEKCSALDLLQPFALSEEGQAIIQFIIGHHCVDDPHLPLALDQYGLSNVEPEKAVELMYIFKDADGLDRIRIFDLDVSRLRSQTAKDLLLLARQLYDYAVFNNYLD